MSRYFHSFYGKLTSVFLMVLIVMGIAQVIITTQSFLSFNREVDQRLNLTLASDMASELTSVLDGELDLDRVGERIHYMMVMNPKIEIYLLNEAGFILALFAEPGESVKVDSVDLNPVYEFLLQPEDNPILGSDPRQPDKKKPFSAAEMVMGDGSKGFLYIIIGGERYDSTYAFFRESYFVRTMVNGMSITLFFAGVIGLLLFAFLTKRLTAISDVVAEFEKGNLEHRITVGSRDEFGQLGNSFNSMADKLESTIEKLKQNDTLRRELIANVSHDLRTPLASIQGFVETILMKSDLDEEKRVKYLNVILTNTTGLSKQVGELFELSKLEANQIQPNLETFSIGELVQDVILKFHPRVETLNIDLTSDMPDELPLVNGDIAMIERVLSNLIRNATEYTLQGDEISVSCVNLVDSVLVSISDTGAGIDPAELPYIFDRFYSSGKKTVKGSTSTGLGLTIASKMIQAHGQLLSVESQLRKGTKFSFELPT